MTLKVSACAVHYMSMYEAVAGVSRSEVPVVPEEEDDEDGRRVFKNNRR